MNDIFSATYDPAEIADCLCKFYDNGGEDIREDLTDSLYYLMAAAENPHNADHFRILYAALENLIENMED